MLKRQAVGMKDSSALKVNSRVIRAGRPTTALITRQSAAEAALAMIDQNGLEALSLLSVARVLGVSAPSLYHHFRDKDELLANVARRLLQEIGKEQEVWSSNWEERMLELGLATRRVMLRHPNAASLVLRFFPRQVLLAAYEKSLEDCPYPPEVQIVVSDLTEKFTYGSTLFAAAAEAQHIPPMPPVDHERYPRLAHALKLAPPDEEIFVEGLRALLDGIRTRFGNGGT